MKQVAHYIWPSLLLLAAVLSPNASTTVTLLAAGILTILLALSRERRLTQLADELSYLLSIKRKTSSIAVERSLGKLQSQTLLLVAACQLVIFTALLVGALDLTVARNYALLVLVALAPLGLELELIALLRAKHSSETVRTAIGYASEDSRALLAIIGLSLIGTLWLHIPPALSALQIVFISCVARPLLSGLSLQSVTHKAEQLPRVIFSAVIVYGSFIFFFIRHYIEPRYADATNVITWQATTVALLVFIACQAAPLFSARQLSKNLVRRAGALLVIILLCCYVGPLKNYLETASPSAADWAWILLAGPLFMTLVVLRRRATLLQ